MVVEIDSKSGFCFGVRNAVEIAEKALLKGEKVYSLGSIVHNDAEVERLTGMGLITINKEEFSALHDTNVLIRAHGEPPSTYLKASENNIRIIEATCPIVKKLQARIRSTWEKTKENSGQVVIFGKPGHAEVIGLLGQTNNEGILVSRPSDLDKIDFSKQVYLFSQTTMGIREFEQIREIIGTRMVEAGITDVANNFFVIKSICGQVSNREPHLREFAGKHDVIIFVSGRESSNGKMLFSVCRNVNPRSWFVSSPADIEKNWFEDADTVGICGATSTPKWLIEQVKDFVKQI